MKDILSLGVELIRAVMSIASEAFDEDRVKLSVKAMECR